MTDFDENAKTCLSNLWVTQNWKIHILLNIINTSVWHHYFKIDGQTQNEFEQTKIKELHSYLRKLK